MTTKIMTFFISVSSLISLVSCGSDVSKSSLKNIANKQIMSEMSQQNGSQNIAYCKPVSNYSNHSENVPPYYYNYDVGQLAQYWGADFANFAQVGVAQQPPAIYENNLKSIKDLDPMGQALLAAGLLTKKNFVYTVAGQPQTIIVTYWSGNQSLVQTQSISQYYSPDGQRYQNLNANLVSGVCGGHIAVDQIINYTVPGQEESGVTQTTATATFHYVDLPAWATAGAPPMNDFQGTIQFDKMNNGWQATNFNIPAIQAQELNSLLGN